MGEIHYGLIHTHTENSLNDSVMSPGALVKRAKELGAPAVVLTDHGTLTGVFAFVKAANEAGIKAIPGVEAYMQEDDTTAYTRSHLVLIPKDYEGYRAIFKAVTQSHTRVQDGIPCMNMPMLREFFGEGAPGHGRVIATSACVGGVLSKILLMDRELEKDKVKQQERLAQYNDPNDPVYLAKLEELSDTGDSIQVLIKEREWFSKIAGRKYGSREKALCKLEGEALRLARNALEKEKRESEEAAAALPGIKTQIANLRQKETVLRQECRAIEKSHPKWIETQRAIENIEANIQGKSELYNAMKRHAAELESIFGTGNFYIELQYHGIEEERYTMPLLAKAAQEMRLPTVACNDVHYAENSSDAVRGRQLVQSMRFNKWYELRPGDTEYYIKDDNALSDALSEILPLADVERAMKGIGSIIEQCNVVFPTESHLPKFKGGVPGESTKQRLRRLAEEGISWRYPNPADFTEAHRKRMEYELEVIDGLGYSDYLCIVQDFLNYGRSLAVDNPEKLGYSVGPGRGSALGSLVCYLTGITDLDPIRYGLLFERFLNTDRVSMPDIDSDFDMEVRGKVLEYVKEKYGEEAVCCILAKGTLAAKAAVRAVARVLGDKKYGDSKYLYDKGNRIAKLIPKTPGIKLSEVVDSLEKEFEKDAEALQIIHDAQLVEGAAINHSMHAAGVIISDNENVGEYIPLIYNAEQEQWMSQCDMVEAEKQAHLMKMDFLGLRTLNIISDTLRLIYRNTGVRLAIDKIPFETEVFSNIFSKGRTTGIFQFESAGMRSMLKQFKPETIEDLILLVAVFRPGPLQYMKEIISNKQGKTSPSYIIDRMDEVLAETYGKPVYQEQIMMIAHKIAGFTMGEADVIRAAIAKKKLDQLDKFKDKFIDGLISAGATRKDAEEFWKEMQDFGRYAFNKSHACAYAHVAYYTAYLKEHYPAEFLCATLNYTPLDKLTMMLRDCAEFGITVLPPDINQSESGFTCENDQIRYGLGKIKTIGESVKAVLEERENGVYTTVQEFLFRTGIQKKTAEALIKSGALDSLCANRKGMLYALPMYQEDLDIIRKKQRVLTELQSVDISGFDKKELASHERKMVNATKKIEEYQYRYETTEIPTDMLEDGRLRLEAERRLLGIYLSGNPLNGYPDVKRKRTVRLNEACENQYGTYCGIINDVTIKNRSTDKAPMAFFDLADESGSIEVCCFTKPYAKYGELIKEGAVVAIKGRCVPDDNSSDDEEPVLKLIASDIAELSYVRESIVVSVPHIGVWADTVYPRLFSYYDPNGYVLAVYDRTLDEMRKTELTVRDDVLFLEILEVEIFTKTID